MDISELNTPPVFSCLDRAYEGQVLDGRPSAPKPTSPEVAISANVTANTQQVGGTSTQPCTMYRFIPLAFNFPRYSFMSSGCRKRPNLA